MTVSLRAASLQLERHHSRLSILQNVRSLVVPPRGGAAAAAPSPQGQQGPQARIARELRSLFALAFPLLLPSQLLQASRSRRIFVVCAAGHEHGCQNAFVDHLPECNHYYFKFRVHTGTGVAV